MNRSFSIFSSWSSIRSDRQSACGRQDRVSALTAILASLALALSAGADPILEINSDSLMTYLDTGNTNVQDVRPLIDQRGVNIDGTARLGSGFGMAFAGNPFGDSVNGMRMLNGVNLFTGAYEMTVIDLSLPAEVRIPIGRSYNARQQSSGGSYVNSDGYQGKNWFQLSQPEIRLYEGATDDEDVLYLIYGADRFLEFQRNGATSVMFKGKNGAAGAIEHATGSGSEPDTYTYTDQNGNETVFFGFDGDSGVAAGQFWKFTDPAGNVAFVGDASTGSTAITNGYNASGGITKAYDSADRRYTYTYTSGRLTEVAAETKTGGTWASPTGVSEVGSVEYEYYGSEDFGDAGDLKLVTTTTPLSETGVNDIRKTYYRYYEGAYHATTNPGYPHGLKSIYASEGVRRQDYIDGDQIFNEDFLTETEANLKPYASAFFTYGADHEINSAWFNGECGCSGGVNGTHTFEYEEDSGFSDSAGYDEEWKTRTVVNMPDGSYLTQYFDETGQALSRVISDIDPDSSSPNPDFWVTEVVRDGTGGWVTEVRTPAANSTYTHSSGAITAETAAGLVQLMTHVASGDTTGLPEARKHQEGTSGSEYFDSKTVYGTDTLTVGPGGGDDVVIVRPWVSERRSFHTEGTTDTSTNYDSTTITVTEHTGELAPKQVLTTNPIVTTAQNGSNAATTSNRYLRLDGTTAFVEAEDDVFTYLQFNDQGLLVKRIDDAQTNHASDFASGDDPNTDFGITESGDGVRRITTYTYDAQGRLVTTTHPDGKVTKQYYTKLADGRLVTLSFSKYVDDVTDTYYGPVNYSVMNHTGQSEVSGVIALSGGSSTAAITTFIDDADDDPITAVDVGTLARLSVSVYNESGEQLEESRSYFDIPASGAGAAGTNYDATVYGYDESGNRTRVVQANGTITQQTHDEIGRSLASYVGTNDASFTNGSSSGTDNMVKVSEVVYDGGSAGDNSHVTKRIAYLDDSGTAKRETLFEHDYRGRMIVVENETAPHTVNKYDNLSRTIASGQYDVATGLSASSDPTSLATDRMALSQTKFDALGRVYESIRHKIDPADGSDDDSLTTDTWYDPTGRTIKIVGDQVMKMDYDRLGRTTHSFTLAKDNDAGGYADADDVTGDIVMEESQTVYESTDSDNVLMSVSIMRHHDDFDTGETTGALDSNADGDDLAVTAANVTGRVQINAMWYDTLDRLADSVAYGTNGIVGDGSTATGTFDRDGLSVPARSATALRTTSTYNDDGSLKEITDPKALVTRFEYDDLGRQVAVIRNYVNGTPSGTTGDDDVYTRYVFDDGLQTEMWVDFDGDNVQDASDEVTSYVYGTTKGASAGDSKISSGHLLHAVIYPDSDDPDDLSGNGTDTIYDRVEYAYNALGEQIWTKDQAANVIETDYDDSGREEHRRVTTIDADFNSDVLRVSMTFDGLGRVATVSQYASATVGVGSPLDQVKYTYDGWGNVEQFEQDRDSAVGSGTANDYEVKYTYAKSTAGSQTTRVSTLEYIHASTVKRTITYEYHSVNGRHDDELSRVSRVRLGLTDIVGSYAYTGVSWVVGMNHPEPEVMWLMYEDGTTGSYPDLDRFNRVEDSRWTRDSGTAVDFYDVDISYDENSNITLVEDNVHTGFDASYTNDDLNRLTLADEGTWNGSSITSRTRQQNWTLDQVGNWDIAKLDLDGDLNYNETDEYNDDRTHNVVNELTGRDTDDSGADDYTLSYDEVGNLIDDGESHKYVYDAFGRLCEVLDRTDDSEVALYTYNGLGYRKSYQHDTDLSGAIDGSDPIYNIMYDERWRMDAVIEGGDSDPVEYFINHNAGLDGAGSSTYIDLVIMRDRDTDGNGTFEERTYYLQNWRADVVALVTDAGQMVEWAKYSAYGIPFGLPAGDTDSDGDCDGTDVTQIQTWIDAPAYDERGDLDLDGDVDATDKSIAQNTYQGRTTGWDVLSDSAAANRKAYASYEQDAVLSDLHHVRHRVYHVELGRWTRRDPLGYIDGSSLYEYARGAAIGLTDAAGLGTCGPFPSEGNCCACGLRVLYRDRFEGMYNGKPVDITDWAGQLGTNPCFNYEDPSALGSFYNSNGRGCSGLTFQLSGAIDPNPSKSQTSADECKLKVWVRVSRIANDGSKKVTKDWQQDRDPQGNSFDDKKLYLDQETSFFTYPSVADVPSLSRPQMHRRMGAQGGEWEFVANLLSSPNEPICTHRACWVKFKARIDLTPLDRGAPPTWSVVDYEHGCGREQFPIQGGGVNG